MAKQRTRIETIRPSASGYMLHFDVVDVPDPQDATKTVKRIHCIVGIPMDGAPDEVQTFKLRDALATPAKRAALRALHAEIEAHAESLAGFSDS